MNYKSMREKVLIIEDDKNIQSDGALFGKRPIQRRMP